MKLDVTTMDADDTLLRYKSLLEQIDTWFNASIERFPERINCTSGCSECCRSLFDITLLDAALLHRGFDLLPRGIRDTVLQKSDRRLQHLRLIWPELSPPFVLNDHREDEWQELMPDDDETPCVLLDDAGRCMVYAHRPMTCRLHGLPLVDISGEIMHDEWCTENFTDENPLTLPGLSAPFTDIFREEVALGRDFTGHILGEVVYELDTFIPLALLVEYGEFNWQEWWQKNRARMLSETPQL